MDLKILRCLIFKLLKSSKLLFVTFVSKQSNIMDTANYSHQHGIILDAPSAVENQGNVIMSRLIKHGMCSNCS